MGIQISGQAQGIISAISQKAGAPAAISIGWHNEIIKSDLLPRYAYLAQSGTIFSATYASAATAAASASATGSFCLLNPSGSGRNLILIDAYFQMGAAPAAATTPYSVGIVGVNQVPTVQTAGVTPINLLIGNGTLAVAKPLTAGTLTGAGTTTLRQLGSVYMDVAANAADVQAGFKDQMDGIIVIAPGAIIDLVSISGTPTIVPTLTWAELPI